MDNQIPLNTGQLQGGGELKKKCTACGQENVFIIPQYEIINQSSVSMLVFTHVEAQYCISCGRAFQFVMISADAIACGFMILKEGSGIIKPSSRMISTLNS